LWHNRQRRHLPLVKIRSQEKKSLPKEAITPSQAVLQDAVAKVDAPAVAQMRHMLRSQTMQVQREFIQVTDTRVVLNFPAAFLNRRVEVIALTVDEDPSPAGYRRQPSALIAGRGRTLGDLVGPILAPGDWADSQ